MALLVNPLEETLMPTDIERSYLDRGYILPDGMTWTQVAEHRARWAIDPIHVPIARRPGLCIGWGVPIVYGKHLEHP